MLGNRVVPRVLVFRSTIEDMDEVRFVLPTKADVRGSEVMRDLEL